MNSVITAGLIPNDPGEAVNNSVKLAVLRGGVNSVYWDSVNTASTQYYLDDPVNFHDREVWVGAGMKAVRVVFPERNVGFLNLSDFCAIREMSISGTGAVGAGITNGSVHASGGTASRWSVSNVHIDLFDNGIDTIGGNIIELSHVYMGGCGVGLKLSGQGALQTNALYYRGGEIWGGDKGIVVDSVSTKLLFSGLTIEGNASYAMQFGLNNAKRSVSVVDCYFEQNGPHHIRLDSNFENLMIMRCSFSGGCPIEHIRGGYSFQDNYIR